MAAGAALSADSFGGQNDVKMTADNVAALNDMQ